jgi:hypothetical protein
MKMHMKMFWEQPTVNLTNEEMIDKMRVRELVEYERYSRDNGHKEEEHKCWFDDGEVFTTWFKGPVTVFHNSAATSPKNKPDFDISSAKHKISNTVVWLKGKRAVAESMCTLQFRAKLGSEWLDIQCWCRLHYRVEKRDGKWGIVYFETIYEKDRMDPVFSDSNWKVPREELVKYRPINWNMSYRRDLFEGGLKNADQWAGTDKPETLQRLYEESSSWIEKR